jgi:hypothetical protein
MVSFSLLEVRLRTATADIDVILVNAVLAVVVLNVLSDGHFSLPCFLRPYPGHLAAPGMGGLSVGAGISSLMDLLFPAENDFGDGVVAFAGLSRRGA